MLLLAGAQEFFRRRECKRPEISLLIRPHSASRVNSSSSTIATNFGVSSVATFFYESSVEQIADETDVPNAATAESGKVEDSASALCRLSYQARSLLRRGHPLLPLEKGPGNS
jgi:hypothetical protein